MARALVVDDNLLQGKGVAAAAQALGHEAVHVLTLAQGLKLAGQEDFQVIFVDSALPDGDGVEALAEFSDSCPGAQLAVMATEADMDRARQSPSGLVKEVMAKPVEATDVAVFLSKVLGSSGQAGGFESQVNEPQVSMLQDEDLPLLKEFRDAMECKYLEVLLEKAGKDVPRALKTAGISRAGYYNLLKKHGLTGKTK